MQFARAHLALPNDWAVFVNIDEATGSGGDHADGQAEEGERAVVGAHHVSLRPPHGAATTVNVSQLSRRLGVGYGSGDPI